MKKVDKTTFGEFVKERRQILGYTQEQLAEQLNVSMHVVSKWENGVRFPNFEMAESLADVLGVSVQELFDKSKVEVLSAHANPGLIAIGVVIVGLCVGGVFFAKAKINSITPVEKGPSNLYETIINQTTADDSQKATVKETTAVDTTTEDSPMYKLKNPSGYEQYDEILEKIVNGKAEQWSIEQYNSENLTEVLVYGSLGYCLKDLDGNGIPELLLGDLESDATEGTFIYQIFTIENEKSVEVIRGSERNKYIICSNGYIENEASSGAEYSNISYYILGGSKLKLMEEYEWNNLDSNFTKDKPWLMTTYNGEKNSDVRITEDDANKKFSQYQKTLLQLKEIN